MKKTLLAAALMAGFAGVAQAETSVTLYGIVDTGIGYQQIKGSAGGQDFKFSKTGLINGVQSGSRWGLKGAEDLGNGLRAVFVLESGFDSSTGKSAQGSRLFGRQATVGLASDAWGQFDLGRQTNIASKYMDIASPFGASFGQANIGATFGSANTTRWDNMVMYQTPNFSGFQFGVGYSFNADGAQSFKESGERDPNTRGITTGIRYANGPIAAAVTYDQVKTDGSPAVAGRNSSYDAATGVFTAGRSAVAASDDVTIKQWNLGLSYDFEVVKLHAGFGQTRDGWINAYSYGVDEADDALDLASKGFKANLYTFGVSAPVGNGKVMASWAMADPKGNASGEDKQHIYSLGYTYSLSKRTNVYAYGSYAKNVYFSDDVKSQVLGVGVRHQF